MLRLIVVLLASSSLSSALSIEWLVSSMLGMLDALELTDLMLERRLFLDPFTLERRGMPPTLTKDDTLGMPSPLLEPLPMRRRLFLEPFMLERRGMPPTLTGELNEGRLFLESFMLERRGMPGMADEAVLLMPDGRESCVLPSRPPVDDRKLFFEPFLLERSGVPMTLGDLKLAEEAYLLTWCMLASRPRADEKDILLPTGLAS
mmetsp:Transcript_48688/g.103530  ORF Transcript_48688/g.103530 Transcript_48688/m.103530 type:complete len:204 (+) Transcript_48688:507-1118(+)